MIRLKKLLLETYRAEKLCEEYGLIYPAYPIYRGMKKHIEKYEKYNILKNRLPKDTRPLIDSFFEVYRDLYFDTLPSRREMLFCTPSVGFSTDFGRPYLIYPSKDCKFYYLNSGWDSIIHTDSSQTGWIYQLIVKLKTNSLEETDYILDKEKYPNLYVYLMKARTLNLHIAKEWDDLNFSYMKSIVEELGSGSTEEAPFGKILISSGFRDVFDTVKEYLRGIVEFDPLESAGVAWKMKEIYITGDYYYAVNIDWAKYF